MTHPLFADPPASAWSAAGGAWLDLADPALSGGQFDITLFEPQLPGSYRGISQEAWARLLGALAQATLAGAELVGAIAPDTLQVDLHSYWPDFLKLHFAPIRPWVRALGRLPGAEVAPDNLQRLGTLSETLLGAALPGATFTPLVAVGPGEAERSGDFVVTQVRAGPTITDAEMSAHTRLTLRSFLRGSGLLPLPDSHPETRP